MTTAAAPTFPGLVPSVDVEYVPAPEGAPADAPRIFAVIAAVMAEAMPVGKDQTNTQQNYKFRGIDDVMSAMAGPFRKHGLFILPRIAHHQQQRDGKMTRANILMRYSVYGPAGDCLIAEVPGEASDFADKATNKAQSAALKYLLFTLFMLPVDGRSIDDGDRHHPVPEAHIAEDKARQAAKQQRRQQPRRSDRAEGGQWEQPAQQPQQQGRRDYLAEARKAPGPEQFAAVRAAAVAAGAPDDYLGQLDAIAAEKQRAAQAQQPQRGTTVVDPSVVVEQAPADAIKAEERLRIAASRAHLATVDADFIAVYGVPIEQATAQQLNTFADRIEQAGATK
ncbi:ERF family protein [Streptomyces sp. NPDC026673]|uniref:ERF family protein n=1 Tax=Streptomyces sp. NPDC026673 TaxID=3155724 RepID=UPI0033D82D2C